MKNIAVFLATLMLPLALQAEPQVMNACTQAVFAHPHLSGHPLALSEETNALFKQSLGDAYTLSMPLMAAGMVGDRKLYSAIETSMNLALKKLEEDSAYTDWLRGRMVLADFSMNGKITRHDLLIPLQHHIDFSKKTTNFMAWAAGYLAAVDYTYRDKMLKIVHELTADKTVSKSDKLWAWVLVLQAAGNHQDRGTYLKALDQINILAGKSHLGESLLDGLVRTQDSSDYPAWALGIARLASANMGDSTYFNALERAMNQSLDAAKRDADKDYKARAEKLLAEVNNIKAIERNTGLLNCRGGKPVQPESCGH